MVRRNLQSNVAFTCSFARRTCSHDLMFYNAYQRTNRTRGTKILRCFPHCCPRHVERSYCGGPVYLQVDLVAGDWSEYEGTSLCVFAHFHPKAMSGLVLGQFEAYSMFRANQQTDTNATGEWIGARLMASADHTTWLFEVNPSGRWYYQWESGATKAQRATEHVFEAYVFVHHDTLDRCEVVAKAISPDFKMISFRRAPSEAKAIPSDEGVDSPGSSQREIKSTPDDVTRDLVTQWGQRDSVDSMSSDAEMATQFQRRLQPAQRYTESSPSRANHPERQSISSPPSPVDRTSEIAPLSLLPSPQIVHISHQLGSIVDCLQELPSIALEAVTTEIHRVVLVPLIGRSKRTIVSLLAPPRAFHEIPSSRFPVALVGAVLRLAVWLLFDQQVTETQENAVEQASAGLLDKAALYESYFVSLEHLHHQIESFLATTRAQTTLATLAHEIDHNLNLPSRPQASPRSCRGLESFVAQTREVFLAGGDLRPRRRRRVATPSDDFLVQELRQFSAMWIIDIESIQWRSIRSPEAPSFPSAFVALWMWRQVLGVDIAVDEDGPTPTLVVTSFWNPSRRRASMPMARGSQLVLDGRPRWLRVYPSGESTSSITLGSQRLGHYVASFRRETHEVLVNLYLWPCISTSESSCYCLRWCLRLERESNVLDVRVGIERGHLRRGVHAMALDESPLNVKLQAVNAWTTIASLHFTYDRH